MRIYDFVTKYPNDHIRIIRYEPAQDIVDDNGNLVCGGEDTSTIVFDSTTGEGDLDLYLMKEIINSPEDEMSDEDLVNPDHIWELEYMPDEYWELY